MARSLSEEVPRPGKAIEELGIGMLFCSLVALLILNCCASYSLYYSELPPEKAEKASSMCMLLIPVGLVCLVAVGDLVGSGFHCCLFALPLALGNYLVATADLLTIIKFGEHIPMLRIFIGIALGVFLLAHPAIMMGAGGSNSKSPNLPS